MFRRLFAFLVVIISFSNLYGEDDIVLEEKYLSHGQVAFTGWFPYSMISLGTLGALMPEKYKRAYKLGTSIAADIPACVVDPWFAVPAVGISSSIWTVRNIYESDYEDGSIGKMTLNSLAHCSFDMDMLIAYKGYAEARKRAVPGSYPEYEQVSIPELLMAPFNPKVLKENHVWLPIVGLTLLQTYSFASNGLDESVFKTGKGYFGKHKINVAAGLGIIMAYSFVDYAFVGAGEEALYRGIGYEEAKLSFGLVPGKIIDCSVFAGVHVPQDIKDNGSVADVFAGLLTRACLSYILDSIYDIGGLRSSAAVHMWYDTGISLLSYLFTCGVANDHPFTIKIKMKL